MGSSGINAGDRGFISGGKGGKTHEHATSSRKRKKTKKKKKKGIHKYFHSKYGMEKQDSDLGRELDRELDKGIHGDYVTGQIGVATRARAWKKKSREAKGSNAAMATSGATATASSTSASDL